MLFIKNWRYVYVIGAFVNYNWAAESEYCAVERYKVDTVDAS